MTIMRDEFHRLVDLLPEEEVVPLLTYVRDHSSIDLTESAQEWPLPEFVGMFSSGDPDFSESSEEFLRTRLGGAADS